MESESTFRPDRYYILSDAGSVYWDPVTQKGSDGFEKPQGAAEWALRQTVWPDLPELLADGVSAIIALGSELDTNDAAARAWANSDGDLDSLAIIPGCHNFARDLGLVERDGR